jgi:hypothetical protein
MLHPDPCPSPNGTRVAGDIQILPTVRPRTLPLPLPLPLPVPLPVPLPLTRCASAALCTLAPECRAQLYAAGGGARLLHLCERLQAGARGYGYGYGYG